MSISPDVNGQHPERQPPTEPDPTVVLLLAAMCATSAGYLTDWETAFTVFVTVVSLFTSRRDE